MEGEIYYFPPELWREILVRSPVYALVKFKCVCKSWCSLINSPDFIYNHLAVYKHNVERTKVVVMEKVRSSKGRRSESIFTIRDKHTFKVLYRLTGQNIRGSKFLSSCNGLILYHDNDVHCNVKLRILNPSMGYCFVLPRCPLRIRHLRFVIGFVEGANDYRVLAYRNGGKDGVVDLSSCIAIFSYKDDEWRFKPVKVKVNVSLPVNSYVSKFVSRSWWHHHCFGAAAHWMVSDDPTCFWEGDTRVLSFDFHLEEFHIMELPDDELDTFMLRFVCVVGNSLAVFGVSRESFRIWIMEKNGEELSWNVCFSGCSDTKGYNLFKSHRSARVSYDENTNTLFLFTLDGKMISYDIRSHQVREIGRTGRRRNSLPRHITYVDTFVESLVVSKIPDGEKWPALPE